MNKKHSTHLKQVEGGNVIKQNDFSSNFVFELQDEYKKTIPALDGQPARIAFVKENTSEIVFETTATVLSGQVEFTITETLEPALYLVEVACGGYIFPSHNTVSIEVTKSVFGQSEPKAEPMPEEPEPKAEETIKEVHEHTAYATITKDAPLQAGFFEDTLGDGMSKELVDDKQLISSSSLSSAVAYSTLDNVEAGDYEILIKARKTSDKVTAIRFGFENFNQTQEISDISNEMTEYSFVTTLAEAQSAMYYHFRTSGSVELESVQIRKVSISDLSWEDAGQTHIGVTQSAEKEIPLEFNRFKWKDRE